jgi:hypothetical protein
LVNLANRFDQNKDKKNKNREKWHIFFEYITDLIIIQKTFLNFSRFYCQIF